MAMDLSKMDFINQLKTLACVDAIYLYGSRARGTSLDRSDIDIAIEAPRATTQEWNEIDRIIKNSNTLLKIDCVDFGRIKNKKLYENIMRERKTLFRRNQES